MTSEFSPGSKLGDYVLDAYVGAGSFGIVWRGHVESTGETVAVKLLTGALSEGNAASLRGDVEVLAATAASRSPHVVRVLGGASQPVPYIVMEFVRGTDLAATLQSEGRLTPSRTIDVGVAISDALRVLHQARIVHRDIKPANVLVNADGVIKLTDFGVAKIVGYETITMTGQVAMTMAYAAPEIWEDDDDGDLRFGRPSHRSDLYALGILLYQCLCGVTPFRGNYGVLYRAHRERSPDLSTLPAETPASLREGIRRCLEKRQEDRPVDAAELHRMLERAAVELQEAKGELPAGEPAKFGPWQRTSPHSTQPWAFCCRHETSGEEGTVEVFFADDVDVGEHLRLATRANSKLVPLGAEKIIESNRLLLRPQESWHAAPPGEFQFWLAREDRRPEPATTVSARALQRGIVALDALIEAAARDGIALSLRDNLTLTAAGDIYLMRVGLVTNGKYVLGQAMTALAALPLDNNARAFLAPAKDFADLISRARIALESAEDDSSPEGAELAAGVSTELVCRNCHQPLKPGELICANCGHYQAREAPMTISGGSPFDANRLAQSTQLASGATGSRVEGSLHDLGGGAFELILRNLTAQAQTMRFSVASKPEALRVELPGEVTIPPSGTERVKVSVSASSRRFGARRRYSFTLVASGAGGSGDPPLTIEGSFEDEGSPWPLFAAASAGALLVALIAIVGALLLTGGGKKEALSVSRGAPSDKAKANSSVSGTPSSLPTLTTVGRVCPTSAPTNDIQRFEGCRVYEAIVGSKASFGSAFLGICSSANPLPTADKDAAEIRFEPSAAVFQLNQAPVQAVQYLNTPSRQTYVGEYDIAFDPGADMSFTTRLNGKGGQSGVILTVRSRDEFLVLQWTGDSSAGDLSPRIAVPGLAGGRHVTIGVAVNGTRYSVFVDGKLATEIVEPRGTTSEAPYVEGIACPSGRGTLRVSGARIYELGGGAAAVPQNDPGATASPPATIAASPAAATLAASVAPQPAPAAAPTTASALAAPAPAPPAATATTVQAIGSPHGDVDKFRGRQIFVSRLDGSGFDFQPTPLHYLCTPAPAGADINGSSLRNLPGALELSTLKEWSGVSIGLNMPSRPTYLLDADVMFDPGAQDALLIALRGNSGLSVQIFVRSKTEHMAAGYVTSTDTTEITSRYPIPGLGNGRRVTISAAVAADRYTIFLDGKQVLDVAEGRVSGSSRPSFASQSCSTTETGVGIVRILGVRVYELAGQ